MEEFPVKRFLFFIAALAVFSTFSLFGDEIEELNSRLRKAIDDNDISTAQVLLDSGADANGFYYEKRDGVTFLMRAISKKGTKQLAVMLLDYGADTEARDDYERTAAFYVNDEEGVALLAARGVRFDVTDKGGRSPLRRPKYLNAGAALPILKWEEEYSPGFSAQFENRDDYLTDIFVEFLNYGFGSYSSETYPLLEHLLKSGVNPAAKYPQNFSHPKGALIEYLTYSIKSNTLIITLLVEHGMPVNDFDKEGKTFLHYAVEKGNNELVDFLLSKGVDPNIRTSSGETALMIANSEKRADSEKIVSSLLNYDADPNLQDKKGETALMKARDQVLIKLLLHVGANPMLKDVNGRTMLSYHRILLLLDGPLLDELISSGFLINEPDYQGLTPLMYAVKRSYYREAVLALLEKGADPNCRDPKGRNALHLYLLELEKSDLHNKRYKIELEEWDRSPIAAALLESGINPADRDNDGDSALITAARLSKRNPKMVPLSDLVFQYADNDEIIAAQKAFEKIAAKEKREEDFDFRFDNLTGNAGFGFDIGESFYFNQIIDSNNLILENTKTGIGFDLVLARYVYGKKNISGESKHSLTFINANLYWNLDVYFDKTVNGIFGPFAAINYGNIFNFKDFTYKFGFRYLMRRDELSSGVAIETGYKNTNNKPSFFFELRFGFLDIVLFPIQLLLMGGK